MACIDNIVSIGLCDDEISTSGLTLMGVDGMSPLNGERIATEQYGTGIAMFRSKKNSALTYFKNDFVGVLQANNTASILTEKLYDSSYFNTTEDSGTYAGYRGQVVRSGIRQGGLRRLKVKYVQCYPLVSGVGAILIKDYINGVEQETTIAVNFVANQLNTFEVDYSAINHTILVLIDNTTFHFGSSVIVCQSGCNGKSKNPCGSTEGFDGTGLSRTNGYGLNIQYSCECDYEQLICNFAKSFTGELILLKWQELVLREMYSSNRWNAWIVYNRDEIWDKVIPDVVNRYAVKFNAMVQGSMFEMLKQYQDECLNCRGIKIVTNI